MKKLALFLILLAAPAFAEFDPQTIKGMEVLKAGVCDIEAVPDLSIVNGAYICVVLAKDEKTVYVALFHTVSEDLQYVIEFIKDGETSVVWRKKAPPCVGNCA